MMDTVDWTAIDRANSQVVKLKLGSDYLYSDIKSGATMYLRDLLGVENSRNKIEFVRAQFRDPLTGAVDPSKTQLLEMGYMINAETDFDNIFEVSEGGSYDALDKSVATFRRIDSLRKGAVERIVMGYGYDSGDYPGNSGKFILSIPTLSELGFANASKLALAWNAAADNVALLG